MSLIDAISDALVKVDRHQAAIVYLFAWHIVVTVLMFGLLFRPKK